MNNARKLILRASGALTTLAVMVVVLGADRQW